VQFGLGLGKIIRQDGKRKTGDFLELEREVIPVFVECFSAGRERAH